MLQAERFDQVSASLPSTIRAAIDQPPISEVMKISGKGPVIRFVEFELIKMTALVSVGNNLNNAQVEFIATQLVEMFPNESMSDFKICFQRGCIGQYGEIFRMDGIVLRNWMKKYLEEKYEVLVDDLNKYKDRPYDVPEKSEEGPGYREFKEYAKSLSMGTKAPDLSDEDIRREGQEKPRKRRDTGHPRITEEGIEASRMQDLRLEYGREHTDIYSGKTLEGHPTFDEWLKTQV